MKLLKYYPGIHIQYQIIVQLSILNAEFSFIKKKKKVFCARLISVLIGSDEDSPLEHQKKEYKFGNVAFSPSLKTG